MKWTKDGEFCLVSDAGYRITKTSHTSGDWQYASIHRKEIIGTGFSAGAEKSRCELHTKGKGK